MSKPFIDIDFNPRPLQRALRQYVDISGKDAQEVVEKKAKQLSIQLFKGYREIMPSAQKIWDEARARNWRTKRPPGVTVFQELTRRAKLPPRGYLSVGWLYRNWRVRGSGSNRKRQLVKVRNPRGRVLGTANIKLGRLNPQVVITNKIEGVVVQNKKHKIIEKSVNAIAVDMWVYINRKQRQRAIRFSRGNYFTHAGARFGNAALRAVSPIG